jgi:hypothetical protein
MCRNAADFESSMMVSRMVSFFLIAMIYDLLSRFLLSILVLQLPEPAEVGVRFCKPGRRRHRSAKLDTEDSDTETQTCLPAVDRRSIDRFSLTAEHSNDGAQRGSVTRITGTP